MPGQRRAGRAGSELGEQSRGRGWQMADGTPAAAAAVTVTAVTRAYRSRQRPTTLSRDGGISPALRLTPLGLTKPPAKVYSVVIRRTITIE